MCIITAEFPCIAHHFKCEKDRKCISLIKKCDGINDCSDGADELNCSMYSSWYLSNILSYSDQYSESIGRVKLLYIDHWKTYDLFIEGLFYRTYMYELSNSNVFVSLCKKSVWDHFLFNIEIHGNSCTHVSSLLQWDVYYLQLSRHAWTPSSLVASVVIVSHTCGSVTVTQTVVSLERMRKTAKIEHVDLTTSSVTNHVSPCKPQI